MFEKLKSAIFEAEPVKAAAPAPAGPVLQAGNSVLGTTAYTPTLTTSGAPVANDEIFVALLGNINAAVNPNPVVALDEMVQTMLTTGLDEGNRIKASAAALKIAFSDVDQCVTALQMKLGVEKDNFTAQRIGGLDADIANDAQALETVKINIEAAIAKLNEMSQTRDALIAQINQKQADRNNEVAVFEATVVKVNSKLEEERRKMQVYLPQEVK